MLLNLQLHKKTNGILLKHKASGISELNNLSSRFQVASQSLSSSLLLILQALSHTHKGLSQQVLTPLISVLFGIIRTIANAPNPIKRRGLPKISDTGDTIYNDKLTSTISRSPVERSFFASSSWSLLLVNLCQLPSSTIRYLSIAARISFWNQAQAT